MSQIILATLNARYAHSAFGLRYLMANMGDLAGRTRMMEFDINQPALEILQDILAQRPAIVGLGVYVWNITPITQVAMDLKRLCPEIVLVIGGPEVSHGFDISGHPLASLADYIIAGQGELALPQLCRSILRECTETSPQKALHPTLSPGYRGEATECGVVAKQCLTGERPTPRLIIAPPPPLEQLALPYDLYDDADIAHRTLYVEASRGCPFECDFCLSALDEPPRHFPLEPFLAAMQRLLDRGALRFKFVDRTFNVNLKVALTILQFFLERYRPGLFLHFEMVPDYFPQNLRQVVSQFPAGALQFEVGVQTLNDDVAQRIGRRQDLSKLADNLTFLRDQTGVHVHADLIVGLPGEDLDGFANGFDQLLSYRPQEIQVGILKRLRGAPIARHDAAWQMVYSAHPPYEILSNRLIDFATMQRLRRFARYWDLLANSGNFQNTTPLLWQAGSAFRSFLTFGDWLYAQGRRTHGIALDQLAALLFKYLTEEAGVDKSLVAQHIGLDYQQAGRREPPQFLRGIIGGPTKRPGQTEKLPPRQSRWQA